MKETQTTPNEPTTPRPENSYRQVPCRTNPNDLCTALNAWGKSWEIWGEAVLTELDDLNRRVNRLMDHVGLPKGPGGSPTGATKPPKPPFGP